MEITFLPRGVSSQGRSVLLKAIKEGSSGWQSRLIFPLVCAALNMIVQWQEATTLSGFCCRAYARTQR